MSLKLNFVNSLKYKIFGFKLTQLTLRSVELLGMAIIEAETFVMLMSDRLKV